jgi:aliphatic nitrilase
MGDAYPRVTVAAVQAASVFLDREASVAKACRLIAEAGRQGARIIGFPEGFIPGHPLWYHFHPATGPTSRRYATQLFKNAVVIPSEATEALGDAARQAGAYVVMGVCEKVAGTVGTMYNSLVFFDPGGRILGVHRKLTPTVGERLVHTGGSGASLRAYDTPYGKLSGLICGENSNPLAVCALAGEHTVLHVASWPALPGRGMLPRSDRALMTGRAFAFMAKAFVLNVCGTVDDATRELLAYVDEDRPYLRDPSLTGGSSIIAPTSRVVAGPLGPEEGVLLAEVDTEECVHERLIHDFAGHYNRPDIFQLTIRTDAPVLVRRVGLGPGEGEAERGASPDGEPRGAPRGSRRSGAAPAE